MKKPWVFIRALHLNPKTNGVLGPGFLNQVPTLEGPHVGAFVRPC